MAKDAGPSSEEFAKEMMRLIDEAEQRMTPWQFRVACWKIGWVFRRARARLWWKGVVRWLKK